MMQSILIASSEVALEKNRFKSEILMTMLAIHQVITQEELDQEVAAEQA